MKWYEKPHAFFTAMLIAILSVAALLFLLSFW
jgi:hypothetical protein